VSFVVRLQDGRAARIVESWDEPQDFNGRNYVGAYSREEFRSVHLGRSESGRWVFLPHSNWQGERPLPYEVSAAEAAGWFAACGLELPEELESVLV